MRQKLKFKKLLNEFRSLKYELEYIEEVLKDSHLEFEKYYREYCEVNDIDLKTLRSKNKNRVQQLFQQKPIPKIDKEINDKKQDHKQVFRDIAKKLHPDKLDNDDPRLEEYELSFKTAAAAMNEGKWGDLFDIADKHDIDLSEYTSINKSIRDDIKRITEDINKKKETYSWQLFNCDEDKRCKDNVVKRFLKHVFNIN